jgi:hypothetical protein
MLNTLHYQKLSQMTFYDGFLVIFDEIWSSEINMFFIVHPHHPRHISCLYLILWCCNTKQVWWPWCGSFSIDLHDRHTLHACAFPVGLAPPWSPQLSHPPSWPNYICRPVSSVMVVWGHHSCRRHRCSHLASTHHDSIIAVPSRIATPVPLQWIFL